MLTEAKAKGVDNRRFIRSEFHVSAKLLLAPTTVTPCRILDISEGGVAIAISSPLPPGTKCMFSFDYEDDGTPRRVNAWGQVIYSHNCGEVIRTGIQLLDTDSYSLHLLKRICRPPGVV